MTRIAAACPKEQRRNIVITTALFLLRDENLLGIARRLSISGAAFSSVL